MLYFRFFKTTTFKAFILFFIIFLVAISFFSRSQNIPPEEIFDRMSLSIYGLSSYKCKVKMNANIQDYGISIGLKGTVFFKEPNKLSLALEDLPFDVQEKYRVSFTQTAVPGMVSKNYKEKYKAKLVRIQDYSNNRKVYVLYMEPYKQGSVKNVLMFVDIQNYTIPRAIIFYKDGGKVTIDQVYSKIDKYYLPSKQKVLFAFPKINASLESYFYDYEINVPIDDKVFKSDDKKKDDKR